ncbi:MAG: glycosyltransferase family 2 protein [Bacteroidales bacterium]|nr:glycosyltransferase family 2 protein [Bacteroidales bacterium]
MSNPLVTVLMPVYNTEKYIAEAIDSVLNQTFRDFEFLIIDDGSTDDSVKIIESYNDKRIRLVRNDKNIKLIATLNKGIDLALGKYICRVDADDICMPTRLEKQVRFMEHNPDFVACSSGVEIFYENSNKRFNILYEEYTDEIRIKTIYQNHFVHPSSFIRKEFIINRGLRFSSEFIHTEDYFFFVKLSELGQLHNIKESLVKVRKHMTNVSVLNSDIQDRNSINVIKYQLNRIGICPVDIDFDLYFRFFYSSFDFTTDEIEKIENLVIDIIKSNNASEYLPTEKLNTFICDKWYHLCVNSTRYGWWAYKRYKYSPLIKYLKISKFKKLRFIIKSLLKY